MEARGTGPTVALRANGLLCGTAGWWRCATHPLEQVRVAQLSSYSCPGFIVWRPTGGDTVEIDLLHVTMSCNAWPCPLRVWPAHGAARLPCACLVTRCQLSACAAPLFHSGESRVRPFACSRPREPAASPMLPRRSSRVVPCRSPWPRALFQPTRTLPLVHRAGGFEEAKQGVSGRRQPGRGALSSRRRPQGTLLGG